MPSLPDVLTAGACRLLVTGQVQGVGFRPFVHRLATELALRGAVRNEPRGVVIELFGDPDAMDRFARRLRRDAPALARIDEVERTPLEGPGPDGFSIVASERQGTIPGRVTVDSATCPQCLEELFEGRDRRHRHALINCTNCGPRYTIMRDLPYDRAATTMAGFPMCDRCEAEYRDPANRRFHAQPTCCHDCGPRLSFRDTQGVLAGDAIGEAVRILRQGRVLAVKGLGGYHLAVDASDEAAVRRLRSGKHRDHKPFALMAPSLEAALGLVELSARGVEALTSPAAPIVLARRRSGAGVAPSVAPGLAQLGVMLPNTPLQHLLARAHGGTLVMTSANLADDPLIADDADALRRLGGIADAWLTHDRPIARAVDDSIVLDAGDALTPIRRARGYVPTPLRLPVAAAAPGLCMGGELKGAIAVVRDDHAVLSQHLGDLGHTLAFTRFRSTIADLLRLHEMRPAWIACDAHPSYLSRREGLAMARRLGCPLLEVQHHHAHFAAVLAEHRVAGPALGIVVDGIGHGADGTAWGGELLAGDCLAATRLGRMRPLRLPGGDAAARETGRCAVSWLADALGLEVARGEVGRLALADDATRHHVAGLLADDLQSPPSSGLGRLFDAAAALLGVCSRNHYEAMSGLLLESLAGQATASDGANLCPLSALDGLLEIDHRPLARRLVAGRQAGEPSAALARLFHDAVADAFAALAIRAAEQTSLRRVAISGGVACNAILVCRLRQRLEGAGLEVLTHAHVPPNDGGLAYGQAAVAAARLASTGGSTCA